MKTAFVSPRGVVVRREKSFGKLVRSLFTGGWPVRCGLSFQQQASSQTLLQQFAASLCGVCLLWALPASAEQDASKTFAYSCAGCHAGGGNTLGGPTLRTADLDRNGLLDVQSLYDLIYKGKGRMPGFGKDCAPRGACTFGPRLSDEDIQQLAGFTLDQAAKGWKE